MDPGCQVGNMGLMYMLVSLSLMSIVEMLTSPVSCCRVWGTLYGLGSRRDTFLGRMHIAG